MEIQDLPDVLDDVLMAPLLSEGARLVPVHSARYLEGIASAHLLNPGRGSGR